MSAPGYSSVSVQPSVRSSGFPVRVSRCLSTIGTNNTSVGHKKYLHIDKTVRRTQAPVRPSNVSVGDDFCPSLRPHRVGTEHLRLTRDDVFYELCSDTWGGGRVCTELRILSGHIGVNRTTGKQPTCVTKKVLEVLGRTSHNTSFRVFYLWHTYLGLCLPTLMSGISSEASYVTRRDSVVEE